MGSLYWRQFMLGAGMVLLTMVLLGVSFYALSYNYTVSEKRSEMRDRANLIAQLSVSYLLPSDEAAATQEDALRALAGVASRMTDVDFLICNRDGDVLLTSDAGLVGKSVRVPEEIVTRTFAEDDGYEGRSTVGVYEQKKFVVGVPMTGEDGAVLGLVLAVMDGTVVHRPVLHAQRHHPAGGVCGQLRYLHEADQAYHGDGAGHPCLRRRQL